MKLSINPMPAAIKAAIITVNRHFDGLSYGHRVHAQLRKRAIAQDVMDGLQSTIEFEEEAKLRGQSLKELARLVLSKPNTLDALELQRQKIMMAVDSAKTPDELNAILEGLTR